MDNNILYEDFKEYEITNEVKENISNNIMYDNLSVRERMGNIYTNKEFEKRSNKVLSLTLPGNNKK